MAQNDYLIAPNTDIYLLKCPIEIDSKNQLDFANATQQHTYFNSLTKVLMENATYIRKDERLYFEGSYDTYLTYNYCMYKNESYSNKWFYAFVVDMRYESNNSFSCRLVTDVWQTWMFEMVFKQSIVERYMPQKANDIIGNFTYPEGFELGDYIANDTSEVSELKTQKMILGTTLKPSDLSVAVNGCYQNIPTGCAYYCFNLNATGIGDCQEVLQALTDSTRQDAVTSLFLAPSFLCSTTTEGGYNRINNSYIPETLTYTLSTSVNGLNTYVPRNNKLYTYPYYFILVTNGAGDSAVLKPELWTDLSTKRFRIYASMTPGCSIIGVPMDYNGHAISWENALPLGKYPQLNYATDQFTNWQTQNGLNNTIQQIAGGVNAVSGAFNVAESVTAMAAGGFGEGSGRDLQMGANQYVGGMLQTLGAMQQKYLASLVPPQFRGNANSGDIWSSANEITYRFNFMSIRKEYAQQIDRFFDMYGYKVAIRMMIQTKTRTKWNYIKTIEANIEGDIPSSDIEKIKNLFNGGFTIWHDTDHYLDYSQTNA